MLMLQQYWPMINMGLMNKGIQLPVMLPSIDSYIEKMKPGLQYVRKTPQGLEFYYKGTGLEVSLESVAVGAGGMAVLMPALSKVKKVAQRVVSGENLLKIGKACTMYANDHDGKFPDDLNVLVTEYGLLPKTLTSARKPEDSDEPDFILIQGLTNKAPANVVLVYENPVFCTDDTTNNYNVLYVDGRAVAEDKQDFEAALQKTYEYLKRPMPAMDW
jgi:hypothetical protein